MDEFVDYRSRQGLRYGLGCPLAVVVAARACAGHDEVAAQAQWTADAPGWVLSALGAKPDLLTGVITTPSEATPRRALATVDAAERRRLIAD
ncbi:MAG: transposase family protein [Pseudonocardiaceae bacterium]